MVWFRTPPQGLPGDKINPLAGGGKYNLYIYQKPNTSSIMFIRVFISHLIGCPVNLGKDE
jgi:hypothetical protein